MKSTDLLLAGILLVLILIWQKMPAPGNVYQAEVTNPLTLVDGQEVKIISDEPLAVSLIRQSK